MRIAHAPRFVPGLISVCGGAEARPVTWDDIPWTGQVLPAPRKGSVIPPHEVEEEDEDGNGTGNWYTVPATIVVDDDGHTAVILDDDGAEVETEEAFLGVLRDNLQHMILRI